MSRSGKADLTSSFRFNKEQEKVEEICSTPAIKIEDGDKKTKESSSGGFFSRHKSHSVDDVSVSSSPGESSSWKLFKERVQQAVEDIKTRKDTKDDESDLDDISECSAKTDATGDDATSDTGYNIVKSFSSFRNKKRSVFSKLASKKESLSPSKAALKKDEATPDAKDKESTPDDDLDKKSQTSEPAAAVAATTTELDDEGEKDKSDIESGVEVLEEMIFIHQTTVAGESFFRTEPKFSASYPSTVTEGNQFFQPNPLDQVMRTIKLFASQEAFMFAILACTVTLILRLSPFYQGAFLATFVMLVYKNTCEWLKQSVINKTLRSNESPSITRSISIHRSSVAEHKPIKSYQGWMNMIEKYKPEEYHVSDTQSVMVKLEGTTLRLCFTRAKISKRHLWNENSKKRVVDRYSDEKVLDIQGAKVELWPRGLARKRYYSRKYPIRILFNTVAEADDGPLKENGANDFKDSFEEVSDLQRTDSQISVKSLEMDDTISNSVSVDTLEYKDCEEDDKNVLYLFARCDREKEDWLRRLMAAALGDVYDISGDSPFNTPTEPTPNKVGSKNQSPDESPTKSPQLDTTKQESEESNNKEDDFDRLDDDAFTVFGQIISPCASRSAADFVQFITAYEHKNLYENRKPIEAEAWLDANLSKPLKPDVFWINLVVGRILYGIIHDSSILDEIHTFLQKKLSAIKLPNFMEEVNIAEINLGNTPPLVHKIYPPSLDERGVWIDADVTYEGLISATISTKLNLMRLKKQEATNGTATPTKDPLARHHSRSAPVETICDSEAESTGESSSDSDEDTSSITETENTTTTTSQTTAAPANKKRLLRIVNTITTSNFFQSATDIPYIQRAMENMSKNLKLRVELKGLVARVVINLPSPPSDRCWLGFRYPPRIYMSAKPTVGEKLFDWTIVTNAIENKLCDEIYKYLVYPNLIDVIMPLCGQPTYRE